MDIRELLENKQPECEWLDYKQEWYESNIELLRDILSFVNTIHEKDCYLVFGVSDDLSVTGIDDDKNRKNKQNIVDLLLSKPLSFDVPKIDVKTERVGNKEIDILIIYNTSSVPLYLTKTISKNKKYINAGQILTRISDTNTASNKSADDNIVELLYKKRLHLTKSIFERYKYLLEQFEDWSYIDKDQKLIYNYDPNFHILIERYSEEESQDKILDGDSFPWLLNVNLFSESAINWYEKIKLMYGNHEIYCLDPFILFDRGKGLVPCPNIGQLIFHNDKTEYRYLIKDSIPWKFFDLYKSVYSKFMGQSFNSHYYATREVLENIVIFKDEQEKRTLESQIDSEMTVSEIEKFLAHSIAVKDEDQYKLMKLKSKHTEYSIRVNYVSKAINSKINI